MQSKSVSLHESTTLKTLYDQIQDCFDYNIKQAVQLLVTSPGLKLIGDDWTCKLENNKTLTVSLGMAIFGDFTIFAPGATKTAIIGLPADMQAGFLYLHKIADDECETDHPYYIMPDGSGTLRADAYRHTCAELILDAFEEPGPEFIKIAILSRVDGEWTIIDQTDHNQLKLTEAFPVITSSDITGEISAVENLEVSTSYPSLMRQESAVIGGALAPIDKSQYKNDLPIITVSWDTPTDELAVGKTFAYKIVAHPTASIAYRGTDMEEYLLYPDSLSDRVYCSFYASDGVEYEITVYRLVNPTRALVSVPSDPETIRAGLEDNSSVGVIGADTLELRPAFEMSSMLEIIPQFSTQYATGNFRMQLFVFDAKLNLTIPIMPPSDAEIQNLKYLYYEGPIQSVIYAADPDSFGVAALARVIGSGQRVVATTDVRYVEKTTEQSTNDMAVSFYIPDSGEGQVSDRIIYETTVTRPYIIRALMMSGFDTSDGVLAGQLQVYRNGDDPASGYILDYDDNGDGYTDTFTGSPPMFDDTDSVMFRCIADGATTDPSRCLVVAYIRNVE